MMSTNTAEFLNELDEQEGLQALHTCFGLKSEILLKNENDPNPVSTKIEMFSEGKVFLDTSVNDKISKFTGITNIKFFIGTEVYFIKVALEVFDEYICFNQYAKVIQLRRRKEPRYNIPEKWSQTAAIWSIELKIRNPAKVIDISGGGIRLEIPNMSLDFKKGDTVRIQFQIFKRADIVCDALAKFILKKPNGTTLMGLEFDQLQKSHKSRINSIVDDLENHLAHQSQPLD